MKESISKYTIYTNIHNTILDETIYDNYIQENILYIILLQNCEGYLHDT